MRELIGFPAGDGLLVSGGNMANIVCLIAARAAATPDVRALGVGVDGRTRDLVAYASKETHTWIQKATDICGLGTDAVRWIETDAGLRMNVDVLRRTIEADAAAGRRPFFVVGTAGSVGTGAIDPLADIAAVCRERAPLDFTWTARTRRVRRRALPDARADLRALSEADSVAVDPHKWLYAPLEAGCALLRDRAALRTAFALPIRPTTTSNPT